MDDAAAAGGGAQGFMTELVSATFLGLFRWAWERLGEKEGGKERLIEREKC